MTMKFPGKKLLTTTAFTLIAGAVLLLSSPVQAQTSGPEWTPVTRTTIPVTEEVVGMLQPTAVTTLSSKVMGNVVEVLKREGETVQANELLVRIDAKEIGSDLAGAKASLAEAQAAIAEIKSTISTAQSAKEAAESQLKLAEVSYARIKELYDKKSTTQQEHDQAFTKLTQAKAQVNQATSQIASLQARMAQINARNEQARAGISKVSTLKDLAEVRAPFAGRIISRKVEPGMLAAPGVPLMVIEDLGRIRFEAIVPERLLSFLPDGAEMPVRVDALGQDSFSGNVVEIVPSGDPLSHTFTVKLCLADDPRFRTGMYARGTVKKGEEQVLLVPATAIVSRGQLDGVILKSGEKSVYRLVKVGRHFGENVEILSGLNEGDLYDRHPTSR